MKKNITMNKAMAIVVLSVAVPLVCFPAQAKTPKALMVMVDGLRADAVEFSGTENVADAETGTEIVLLNAATITGWAEAGEWRRPARTNSWNSEVTQKTCYDIVCQRRIRA